MNCPECDSDKIKMHVRTQRIRRPDGNYYIKLHQCEMCGCMMTNAGKAYDTCSFESIEYEKRKMYGY